MNIFKSIKKQLLEQKKKAAFELQSDLDFMNKFKYDQLHFDEDNARKRMAFLKKKEDKTNDDFVELGKIEEEITDAISTKKAYKQTEKVLEEVKQYVSMLQ